MPLTDDKIFRVDIDDERLIASISVNGELPEKELSSDYILKQLEQLNIKVDPPGKKNIETLAKSLAEKKSHPNRSPSQTAPRPCTTKMEK